MTTSRNAPRTTALWLVVGLLGILAVAPNAFGQAALDQYIPDARPGGGQRTTDGAPSRSAPAELGPQGAGVPVAGKTSSGSSGGATVPGSDYPLTPFVAIIAALATLALVARFLRPALQRRRAKLDAP